MEETRIFDAKNGTTVSLRPAVPDDAREILNTVRSTALERTYVLTEKFGKSLVAEQEYISRTNRDMNLLLVAVSGERVIGSLAALQADRGERLQTAHILDIGIHIAQEFRGIGIGTQMLRYAEEWARERGFSKIQATIFTSNKRSLRLFSNVGFVEEGTRRKQIRIGHGYIDEVYVAKFLD